MKKRINVKAIGIILATLALFGTGVHFLHGYQVRSNAGILLAQADRAEADGRRDNTANYLRRYISLVPADTDVIAQRPSADMASMRLFGRMSVQCSLT